MLPAEYNPLSVASPRLRQPDGLVTVIAERLPILRHPRIRGILRRHKLVVIVRLIQHQFNTVQM
jgi:hypothetical protein